MINPNNLEGVGMGSSPYAADPIHLNIDFLTETGKEK